MNFGLMTQQQSTDESDERALIFDVWKCLSRVYPDSDRVLLQNLKLFLIAMLGLVTCNQEEESFDFTNLSIN